MPDWSTNIVREARKEHYCSTCGRVIRPGESYTRGAGFDNGTAWSWKTCSHCEAVLHLWNDYVTDWDEGGYNIDTFSEWASDWFEARSVAELRAMAGYRHKWTTAQGNLWPTPERTAS